MEDELDVKIEALTKQRVQELLEMTPSKSQKDVFYMKMEQARLGMLYKRDSEIMKRVSKSQVIRVISLVTLNQEERQKYLKASMPELVMLE